MKRQTALALLCLCPMLASPWAFAQHVEHIHADELEAAFAAGVESALRDVVASIPPATHTVERQTVVRRVVEEVPVPAEPSTKRASLSYGYGDDGGCESAAQTLTAAGSYQSAAVDADATITLRPSGGDCREQSLAYGLNLQLPFALGESGWSLAAKFMADSRSTSAAYVLADETGQVLVRSDGGALFPTILPAGRADTVVGAFVACREFGDDGAFKACAGVNVVPVDWATEDDGRTLHTAFAWHIAELLGGEVDVDLAWDAGADHFGDLALVWRRGPIEVSIGEAWGLSAIDNGAPETQDVAGATFVRDGAPRDRSRYARLGVAFEL